MLEEQKVLPVIGSYIRTYLAPIIILIIVATAFQGWRAYHKYKLNMQTQLQDQNENYKAQLVEINNNYMKLQAEKDTLASDNAKLAADAKHWKDAAGNIPVLPPPSKPPADDAIIVADLKASGVEFRPLTETQFTNYVTGKESLPVIWTWSKQALRIPSLEEKLAATEISANKFEQLSVGYKAEIATANTMLTEAQNRELIRKNQEADLNAQIKNEHTQVVIAQTNGWLKAGAALALGYLAGKAVK